MHKFAGVLTAVIALFVTAPMSFAIAKDKTSVKISPEPTRFKKSANSAPRDAASGQAVGKRIYKPIHVITPANAIKTKHDTVKNSISNIR